jgi:hypothetical protein
VKPPLLVLAGLLTVGFLFPGVAVADTPVVYHSPDDSGVDVGTVFLPQAGVENVHLYIDGGLTGSPEGMSCWVGPGQEICGWDLQLEGKGGLTILSYSAVGDVIAKQTLNLLSLNGGDFAVGSLGPTKLAEIEVDTAAGGALVLTSGQTVGASLGLTDLPPADIVFVPEPGRLLLLAAGVGLLTVLRWRRRACRANREA